jgi:hypothetical protein
MGMDNDLAGPAIAYPKNFRSLGDFGRFGVIRIGSEPVGLEAFR